LKACGAGSSVGAWADFGRIPRQLNSAFRWRIAAELYPCDILFVHRDAEAQEPAQRIQEIAVALGQTGINYIPVIPVRMTEAWLLFDEHAIRLAAGNPHGRAPLGLPHLDRLEEVPDPKRILHEALKQACGLNTRRRSKFNAAQRVHLIPNYVETYSSLEALEAFREFLSNVRRGLALLHSVAGS
jgi:hypothetical protein